MVGDGKHTIAELVELVNQDPRRGVGHEKVLTRLELDAQADLMLERVGYDGRTPCPSPGEVVYLRSTANLSTGGTATDVTDIIHPDNRDMAVRAVRAIGLDVGGVDFISPNIAESYKDIGGGICEINAAPGFRMHVAPSEGTPRDAAGPVIDMLFPPGIADPGADRRDHRHQRQDHHRAHAGAHRQDGRLHARPDHHRRRLHRRPAHGGRRHDRARCRRAWCCPTRRSTWRCWKPRAAVCCAPAWACREVDVGAVLNVASDHLGLKGIDTLEQLAEIKRVVVEVARECAVLNADDRTC